MKMIAICMLWQGITAGNVEVYGEVREEIREESCEEETEGEKFDKEDLGEDEESSGGGAELNEEELPESAGEVIRGGELRPLSVLNLLSHMTYESTSFYVIFLLKQSQIHYTR